MRYLAQLPSRFCANPPFQEIEAAVHVSIHNRQSDWVAQHKGSLYCLS